MDCVRWGLCFISSRGLFSFLNFLLEGVKFCAFGCGCGRSSKFCILVRISLPSQGRGKVCAVPSLDPTCGITLGLLSLLLLTLVIATNHFFNSLVAFLNTLKEDSGLLFVEIWKSWSKSTQL